MGDPEFEALIERHRDELQVHCYRMSGSVDDAEDLVQETFLRAWRNRARFEGRSSGRVWLYRIATNACLDHLRRRRPTPDPATPVVSWLQPLPDDVAVARETVEITFLAAVQHLPPRQRAVLLVRDVLGWRASEAAELMDASVASVNSALQRARATLRERLPERRAEWVTSEPATAEELAVVARYMAAVDGADVAAVTALLADDVRATMPPIPQWMDTRADVVAALTRSWDPSSPDYVGRLSATATRANGGPAVAVFANGKPFAIGLLSVAGGRIAALTAFHGPEVLTRFR